MAEHTPGPWHASSYDGWEWEGHCIRDAHGQIIAKLALNVPGDANVRLIAAAPELLAALEGLMHPHGGVIGTTKVIAMRALIAKVRGEADPTSEDEGRTA